MIYILNWFHSISCVYFKIVTACAHRTKNDHGPSSPDFVCDETSKKASTDLTHDKNAGFKFKEYRLNIKFTLMNKFEEISI